MLCDADTGSDAGFETCSYGSSRLAFRGPARPLDGPYTAVIGGSETVGRFVERPFPDLLERAIGEPVVNLGVNQAGLTLILEDPAILQVAARARLTVLQVLGGQNMSNRFWRVHPRRNDRFLSASSSLAALYPDTDLTDVNFTGHLIDRLRRDPDRFDKVRRELRTSWVARMRRVIDAIGGDVVLLWLSDRSPDAPTRDVDRHAPCFIDRPMLDALEPVTAGLVEVMPSPRARAAGTSGMSFGENDAEAAAALPNPAVHAEVAAALARVIAPLPVPRPRPAQGRRAV